MKSSPLATLVSSRIWSVPATVTYVPAPGKSPLGGLRGCPERAEMALFVETAVFY
jgi:hypothetical protein